MLAQFTHYIIKTYVPIFKNFKSEKIIIFHYWAIFFTCINAHLFMALKTTCVPCSLFTYLCCLATYLTWSLF